MKKTKSLSKEQQNNYSMINADSSTDCSKKEKVKEECLLKKKKKASAALSILNKRLGNLKKMPIKEKKD
jgi:hypothetical protein